MSKYCFFHGEVLEHLGVMGVPGNFTSSYYCTVGDHHYVYKMSDNEVQLLLTPPFKDSYEKGDSNETN